MEKNEEFEVTITDMTEEGLGVGKTFDARSSSDAGFPWFVKDAVIGDRVISAATKVKKSYGFARLVKILEASSDRVPARCPIARACGGCQLEELSYEAQLKFKADKVLSCLTRIGGFSPESFVFEPVIGMENPWRYRNKAQYPVAKDRNGHAAAGFYAGHTHSVIPCSDCMIGSERNKEILSTVLAYMKKCHVEPYDEVSGKGTVRHVLIRESRAFGDVMVCLVINADRLKESDVLVSMLAAACPFVSTVSLCINKENTNVILGEKVITLSGSGYIEDTIGDVRFRISPQSFFQVNPVQVEKLYGKALSYAGLHGSETVWDLYCGVGTISLFLAKHAGKVFGVEIVPQAIENAKENAALNGIENAYFEAGKAEEVTPRWLSGHLPGEAVFPGASEELSHPDVICVDPPRKGCDPVCIDTILKAAPDRVVYVSCDPATLARDCKLLSEGGYRLEKACPVDLFPQTIHVETVCLMSRK